MTDRGPPRPRRGLDPDTRRILELTSSSDGVVVEDDRRTDDDIDEIVSIVEGMVPSLMDGLPNQCKKRIARSCLTSCYAANDIVFRQGDPPDAYYTVIRGAVSIYATTTTTTTTSGVPSDDDPGDEGDDYDELGRRRCEYGRCVARLRRGGSFGELSFRSDGDHLRRNASVLSDGSGEGHPTSSSSGGDADDDDYNDDYNDDVCVLLVVPERCYVSELLARHSEMHRTRDKIDLLGSSPLFRHWTMDRLVKLAYEMKNKSLEGGDAIVRQGERVDYVWMIKDGSVRISHTVVLPNSIEAIEQGMRNSARGRRQLKAPISVDIADLRARDVIGLTECMKESTTRKSQMDAIASTKTELFFVPIAVFKPFIAHDSRTFAIAEQVVERRRKWEKLRTEYAVKFPHMSMRLPKVSDCDKFVSLSES